MRKFLLFIVLLAAMPSMGVERSERLVFKKHSNRSNCYTFCYPTKSAAGEDIVLSAVLIAWAPDVAERQPQDAIESVHMYCHYTITSNHECPSMGFEGNPTPEQVLLTNIATRNYGDMLSGTVVPSAGRCILIAPDYEGYGVTSDIAHPYLAAEATARQVVDAVRYGLVLYQREIDAGSDVLPIASDWRSFTYGYSQGGATALAVHKYLEETGLDSELRFQGSICGGGPHDLVATVRYYMDDNGSSYGVTTGHRAGHLSMTLVLPLIIKGMVDAHPLVKNYHVDDYLSQQFLDTGIMEWLAGKEMKESDIDQRWKQQAGQSLVVNGRTYSADEMHRMFYNDEGSFQGRLSMIFTPECYAFFQNASTFVAPPATTDNAFGALHQALLDNSVATGWTPRHRIIFLHSRYDTVVPYGNYLSFRNAHSGQENVMFRVYDDDFSTASHPTAGVDFFVSLGVAQRFGRYFQWLLEGPATGIRGISVSSSDGSAASFDLLGRPLRPSSPAIVITNGRKVVKR